MGMGVRYARKHRGRLAAVEDELDGWMIGCEDGKAERGAEKMAAE
jgi:hypothetical protein